MCSYTIVPMPFGAWKGLHLSTLVTFLHQKVSITLQKMRMSSILSQAITIGLVTSWFPPLQNTPPITTADLLQPSIFDTYIWLTYHKWSIMDMERFSHLLWANLTSFHFSLFLYFTPLYISLIYYVFLNKTLQDFDNKREPTPTPKVLQETENHPTLVYTHFTS
jgi:hypothetical protein